MCQDDAACRFETKREIKDGEHRTTAKHLNLGHRVHSQTRLRVRPMHS